MITIATFGSHLSAQSIYGTSTNYGGNTTYHNIGGTYGTSTNYGGNSTYHNIGNISGTSTNYGGNTTYHKFNKWPK